MEKQTEYKIAYELMAGREERKTMKKRQTQKRKKKIKSKKCLQKQDEQGVQQVMMSALGGQENGD